MIIEDPSHSYGKDAYYFSHDSNARNDSKCLRLRRVLGMEGYGIFWVLVEMLRDATDYRLPLESVKDIAYETRVSEEKILAVINNFGLFTVEGSHFFSLRLLRSMEQMQQKSLKMKENAQKRWNGNATAMQLQSKGNALKERKGNESKSVLADALLSDIISLLKREKNPNTMEVRSMLQQWIANGHTDIIPQLTAMQTYYRKNGLVFPTKIETLTASFEGANWIEKLKELNPETIDNGKRTPEPDTIGTSAPGSLG